MVRIINLGTLVANPDYYAVTEDTTLSVPASTGVLLNDFTNAGSPDVGSVSQPADGTVTMAADGSFLYTPDPGFVGVDTFTYTVDAGIRVATGTVTVDVFQPLVVATPDTFVVPASSTGDVVNAITGLLANDIAGSGTIVATSFTSPSHGSLSVSLDGSFTYTPDAGFVGDDTFTYYISNGEGTAFATDTIDVVEALPIANNDAYAVEAGDTLLIGAANGLLENDHAFDGTLVATSFSSPAHGSLSVSLDGSFTYVPDPGYVGTDSFTYYISDGAGTADAVVSLDVVGEPPVANPDDYRVSENSTIIATASTGLLHNDFDPNGRPITATSFTSPAHGSLSVSLDGSFTYTPDSGFVGNDEFTYYISDGAQTAHAVVTFEVGRTGVVANPDIYEATEGQALTVDAANGLLLNDYATVGTTPDATSFSSPAHGSLSVSIDGSFTYVPDPGFVGADTFTYYIGNNTGTAFAVDTIDVTAPNLVATPDTYVVQAGDTLLPGVAQGLLANDLTGEGTIVATSFSSPSHGSLSVSLDGSFTYVPDAGYVGTDTFTYYISNGIGTAFAVDTIDVVDAVPIANNDTYTFHDGPAKTFTVDAAHGLLANDVDPGGTVVATSFSSPSHGSLSVSLDGSFTYVPDPGYVGTDTFTYYISDGAQTAHATVALDVVDRAPVAEPDFYQVTDGSTLVTGTTNGLLHNDFDPDGDPIFATSFSSPSHGSLSVSLDGSFTYVPDAGYVGADTFTYYISDGALTADTTVNIQVVACYREGTRIATEHGETAVESLRPGMRVLTHEGPAMKIAWVGHRRIDCARHADPKSVWPILVRSGAFADRQPSRDLYLSPDHAVFVDGVLIPIRHLVNDTSIAQRPVDRVTYHHIELERHAILLAEGLPAESYLDTGNRAIFGNAGARKPAATAPGEPCAPLLLDEAGIEPIRQRLAARVPALALAA